MLSDQNRNPVRYLSECCPISVGIRILALPEVTFLPEASRVETQFMVWTDTATFTPQRWTDAWLAAQAVTANARLVSFDADFRAFPGLSFLHLTAPVA